MLGLEDPQCGLLPSGLAIIDGFGELLIIAESPINLQLREFLGEGVELLLLFRADQREVWVALANGILVKTIASPVNPSDINQVQGVYPSQPEKTTQLGTENLTLSRWTFY